MAVVHGIKNGLIGKINRPKSDFILRKRENFYRDLTVKTGKIKNMKDMLNQIAQTIDETFYNP